MALYPNFCYKQLPDKITTVEISAEVIGHRQLFQVPANNKRFKVLEADGAIYVPKQSRFLPK